VLIHKTGKQESYEFVLCELDSSWVLLVALDNLSVLALDMCWRNVLDLHSYNNIYQKKYSYQPVGGDLN
jgi:hypothetical protein